jgi:hypothetical protein
VKVITKSSNFCQTVSSQPLSPTLSQRCFFDAAALTHFWENTAAMGIINHMRVQLVEEGIENLEDLVEFDKKRVGEDLQEPCQSGKDSDHGRTFLRNQCLRDVREI